MKYVPKSVTRAFGRAVLKTQKNSPTILFVAGVTGAVSATVLACRATLKAQPIIDDIKKDLIDVGIVETRHSVNQEEARKMRMQIFLTGGRDLLKLYGPPTALGVVSIVCLTKSHSILKQREATLTAAYVSLQNFLEGYRGRVREKVGEEEEKNLYYAATPVELVQDTKNGPKKVYGSRPGALGPYAVIWNEESGVFQHGSHDYNVNYIHIQEQYLTDKLRANGYLFLNDVYRVFDIPVTQNGQLCGWIIPYDRSDDFVEIKYTPLHDGSGALMLDFNAAGLVYQMLDDAQMHR